MTKLVKPHPNLHPPSLNSDSSNGPVTFPSSNSDSNSNSNHSSDEHERDRSSEKEHKRPLGLFKTVKRAGSNLRLRSISTFTRSHRRTSSTGDSSRSYSHSSHSLESSESSDRESSNPTHPQLVPHPFPAHPDPPTSTKDLEPRHRHISLPSFSRFRLSRAGSSSSARGGSSSLANTISTTDPKGHSGLVPIPSRVNLPSPTTSLEMERDSGNSIRGTYHSHPPSRSPSMISSDSESVGLSLATPEIVVDLLPAPPSPPPGLVLSLSDPMSPIPEQEQEPEPNGIATAADELSFKVINLPPTLSARARETPLPPSPLIHETVDTFASEPESRGEDQSEESNEPSPSCIRSLPAESSSSGSPPEIIVESPEQEQEDVIISVPPTHPSTVQEAACADELPVDVHEDVSIPVPSTPLCASLPVPVAGQVQEVLSADEPSVQVIHTTPAPPSFLPVSVLSPPSVSTSLVQAPPSTLDSIDSGSEDSEEEDDSVDSDSDSDSLEGRFISSVFIRVPVGSVRKPVGFYLIWWLQLGRTLF